MLIDYRRIETRYRRAEEAKGDIAKRLVPALADHRAALYGAFAPQLGLASNELALFTVWPDARAAESARAIIEPNVQAVRSEGGVLATTVRPKTMRLTRTAGIFVHRWFSFREADWPEYLKLSQEAWPDFEATYDAEIQGFFKEAERGDGTARVLLLTQYATHGEWERSRTPVGAAEEAWKKFMRRHALTLSTIGVSTTLLAPL